MRRIASKYLYCLSNKGIAPLRNGFVELDDDGLVLRTGVCPNPSAEEEFYDGAIVPGFVNAHCHLELSYLKGMFRKGTGMAGFIDQINELRDVKSPAQKKAEIEAAMEGLWNQGVQAMADISNCADTFALKSSHPMYTRTFLEVFGTEPEQCAEVMEGVGKLQSQALEFGLDAAPTPHSCYTMSPQLLEASSAAALDSGFLSSHSEESDEEEEMIRSGSGPMWENRRRAGMSTPPVTGQSSLEYFVDRLLEVHPAPFREHILLVHECSMDMSGMRLVKAVMEHAYIALCPLSNLFIHNTLPPVRLMMNERLNLCIGTDSLSSNDDLSMVKEMYCLQINFPMLSLGELLQMACLNGARFLGKEEVMGSIEAGKRPGIVLIEGLDGNRLSKTSTSRRLC